MKISISAPTIADFFTSDRKKKGGRNHRCNVDKLRSRTNRTLKIFEIVSSFKWEIIILRLLIHERSAIFNRYWLKTHPPYETRLRITVWTVMQRRKEFFTQPLTSHNSYTIFHHVMRSSTKTRAHSKLRLSICATRVQLYEGDRAKVMIINPGPGIIGRLNDALFHKIFPRDVAHARPRSPITNGCVSFPRDPETSNNVAALRISQPTTSSNAGQVSRF